MHRFYVTEPVGEIDANGTDVVLSPEESVHAARVLRLRPGEEVQLLDGQNLYAGVLAAVSEQGCTIRVTEVLPSTELPVHITLWQGMPKADKLEWIVQKATELGVWSIWPVEMERSIAKADKPDKQAKKTARLQRIALEAAKQSGRAHVPEVQSACRFAEALAQMQQEQPPLDAVFVAWEEAHALPLSKAVHEMIGRFAEAHQAEGRISSVCHVVVVIGPEGGISEAECGQLQDKLGAQVVTLGRCILRTETAGLAALSAIQAALGEM